jgi:hypothetical protein
MDKTTIASRGDLILKSCNYKVEHKCDVLIYLCVCISLSLSVVVGGCGTGYLPGVSYRTVARRTVIQYTYIDHIIYISYPPANQTLPLADIEQGNSPDDRSSCPPLSMKSWKTSFIA